MAVGGSTASRLNNNADVDWFSVSLDPIVYYKVYVDVQFEEADDPQIAGIYDSSGTLISGTSDTDSGDSTDSFLLFEHDGSAAETFYIAVSRQSGSIGTYTILVAKERPGVDVSESTDEDLPKHAGTPAHVTVGGSATGTIVEKDSGRDNDYFGLVMKARTAYQLDAQGTCGSDSDEDGGTLSNAVLELIRADGTQDFYRLATHQNALSGGTFDRFVTTTVVPAIMPAC